MAELYMRIDFREVELGDQKEILEAAVESEHVVEYDVVKSDEDTVGSGLDIGDIIINDTVIIERKSPGDFIESMTSGHLEDQLQRMHNEYDHVHVLVSGTYDDLKNHRSRVPFKAIRAFIASMAIRWQTPPLFTSDEQELAYTAIDLGRKVVEPLKRHPGKPQVEVDNDLGPVGQAAMLADDVGPKLAQTIQESDMFWTVKDLCEADVDQLTEIDGIGPRTATKLKSKLT